VINESELLAALPGRHVLIVGDVMLDEYIWGDVRRISPEAPVPIVEIRNRTYVPGGAANTAANVGSLGGQVLLGGVIGCDDQAGRLREALMAIKIDSEHLLVDDPRPTTTKTRIVAHNQQVVRVDSEQRVPLSKDLEVQLLRWVERNLPEADICVLSDYGKGVVTASLSQTFIELARASGKPVIVDPKGTDYKKYRGATVLTPNREEAKQALNHGSSTDLDLMEIGYRLMDMVECHALLITQGPQGMSLFVNGKQPLHIASAARSVFDVSGAGDTVVSTLAMALAAGASIEQAAFLSNRAAGVVVGKIGTATVSIEELMVN